MVLTGSAGQQYYSNIVVQGVLTKLRSSRSVYKAAHLPNLHKGRPQLRQDLPQALSLRACIGPHRLAAAPLHYALQKF